MISLRKIIMQGILNHSREVVPKRIGIDARLYHYGYGIGRYSQQLISALEKIDDNNTYFVFLTKASWDQYQPTNPRFHKVRANVRWYSLAEQIVMPLLMWRYHIDFMHYPHFNVPLLGPLSYIVTIHDLTMLTSPHSSRLAASTRSRMRYEITYAAYRFIINHAIARARHIIAVSQTVKSDIVKHLRINPDRITVIYNGIVQPSVPGEQPAGIQAPFYLAVGSSYPHKNIGRLIDAWGILKKQHFQVPLVLCGQEDVFRNRIMFSIRQHGLENMIIHLGMVPDSQLSWLYGHAKGLIVPSTEEGFGLPAAEALRYGLPSIVSRIPVFTEILDEAALYFDPLDPQDMAKTITYYDGNKTLQKQLRESCLKRATRYDWSQTAQQTYALYQLFTNS